MKQSTNNRIPDRRMGSEENASSSPTPKLNSIIWEVEGEWGSYTKYEVWFDAELKKFYFKKVGKREKVKKAVEEEV